MSATATMIDQRIDSTNLADAVKVALGLIEACERDLGHKLDRGQCNDLLMDNTTWTRSEIVGVMDSISPAR